MRSAVAHAGIGKQPDAHDGGEAMDMRNVNCPGGRFLMCRPEHFAVSYAINPWMDPASWARDERAHLAAAREWRPFTFG